MLGRTAPSRQLIGRVLGAAVAAAADRESADRATVRAFAEAAGGAWDADELAATAVRLALREAPAVPFCAMASEDAEAIALARLLQLPETRIAALLEIALASFYGLGAQRNGWLCHRALPGCADADREALTMAGLDVAGLEADGRLAVVEPQVETDPATWARPWVTVLERALARGFDAAWSSRFPIGPGPGP
jgi:hypothetical protein